MTTPNQPAPDGAYTVGGGEFRFGQRVDESVITDLFQVEIPSKAELGGLGIRDILTGDYDVASNYLGRALGNIPFETLKQFERFVLEPTEEDPEPTFVDQEDGINKILESFGVKSATGDDIWDRILEWMKRFFPGAGGDPDGAADAIQTFFDKVQENLETLNEMTAPGNKVISPNFELPSIIREPYGTPTVAYTTLGEGVKRMGFRSLKFTTTAAAVQGVYLSPSQRRRDFIVRPGLYSDSGLNIKAHASNGTAGSVSLKFRWYDGDTFLSEDSTTVLNSEATLKSTWYDLELEAMAPDHCDRLEMFVVASADSAVGNTYYLDAAFLRDKTRLQKVIEDMLAALNGESGSGTLFDRIKALRDKAEETQQTVEGMNSPGNRFLSPNLEFTFIKRFPYGTPEPTVEYSTEQSVLGSKSLKWITTSAAVQGIYLNPTQKTTVFNAQPGTVFDCFCKLRGYSGNSTGTTSIVMRWQNYAGATLGTKVGTVKNNSDSTFKSSWVDFEVMDEAPHDATGLEVYLISSADTAIGSRFYVDAAAVQEKTVVQKVIDNIHEAIDGAVAARNERVETVKEKFQQVWGKLFDGLKGHSSGTTAAAVADDVYAAAAEVQGVAATAQEDAGTALDGVAITTDLTEAANSPNLVTSPRWESTEIPLATNNGTESGADAQMELSTDFVHTTGRSVKTVGTRNVYPMIQPYGNVWDVGLWTYGTVDCVPGDVFYMESWIYRPTGNTTTIGGFMVMEALKDGWTSPTAIAAVDCNDLTVSTWTKLSGYFTVPSGWYKIGFRMCSGPVIPGFEVMNTYYWGDPFIVRSTETDKINQKLYNANEPATTIVGTAVPGLDAAKITTGVFTDGQIASGLSASKLTTGTLPAAAIAGGSITDSKIAWDLNGGKISYGTVDAARIAALDAAKITTGEFGSGQIAANAITTSKIADSQVTGVKTAGLDASKLTGGTVAGALLPAGVAAASVGSGINAARTTGAGSFTISNGVTRFPTSFYNAGVSGTSDIVITTDTSGGGAWLKATAQYAGWYMVEIAFGINQATRSYSYTLAPLLFKGNTGYKLGNSADYKAGVYIGAFVPNNVQSSFIIYLNAGESANPGVQASGISGSDPLIQPQSSTDTYFSIALLNRSLS